jgi:hypothetical protein
MMDQPSLLELVTAVREFIEQKAIPELKGHTAFHARVAANALLIAERQIAQGEAADEAERARLTAVLGRDGTLEELNRALCLAIRDGSMALDDTALKETLRLSMIDKVKIDQPNYSGLKTALARADRGG